MLDKYQRLKKGRMADAKGPPPKKVRWSWRSSVGFLWRGRGVVKKRKQIHRVHYDLEVGSLWLYDLYV